MQIFFIIKREATWMTPDKTHQRHVAYQKFKSLIEKREQKILINFFTGQAVTHPMIKDREREKAREASCGLSFMVDSILHLLFPVQYIFSIYEV